MERRRTGDIATSRLSRLRALAYLSLVVEWLWPVANALFCIFGVFLITSWLDLWSHATSWMRFGAYLGLLTVAAALSVKWLRFTHLPSSDEALKRLDNANIAEHRPAQTASDALTTSDKISQTLWSTHIAEAKKKAAALRFPSLRPQSPLRDPASVRAAVLVGIVAAGFVAGDEKWGRTLNALQISSMDKNAAGRSDAWVDPPAYTGRPPIVLLTDGSVVGSARIFDVPIGSEIIVRSQAKLSDVVMAVEGLQPSEKSESTLQRYSFRTKAHFVLRDKNGGSNTFTFTPVADSKPLIEFQGPPSTDGKGLLSLSYSASDDYGLASAEAILKAPRVRGRGAENPLFERPAIPLNLPRSGPNGEGNTIADLAESPWAGAEVVIQLFIRDEAGNEGASSELHIETPQRAFAKPLAKAIIEQRRNLALFPEEKRRVIAALEAIRTSPDRFPASAGQHLALHVLLNKLQTAKSQDSLREAVAFMWEMALRLEEGDIKSAEDDLRAAENNLRDALENNASEQELQRLSNELRMAMERYLRELAENQAERPDETFDTDQQTIIGSKDLNKSIDDIERMARSGDVDNAKKALEQLKELLKNLKSARKGQQGRSAQESNKALNQLDQMLRDQQQLRDRTYDSRRGGDESDTSSELKQSQNEIRQRLEDLQRRMRQFGMRTDEGLEDAEDAMREAEQHLRGAEERRGEAVDAQGRAIDGLRKGAESLARQRKEGGRGEGEQAGSPDGGNGSNGGSDPLGRESRTRGDQSQSAYDPLGTAPPQRAQQLLEELRRRLGDPGRNPLELEYLERLMRRY